ncbi:MAG: hypothetical protein ACSHYF_08685 [Verrucomicrobiaceae bacterium]
MKQSLYDIWLSKLKKRAAPSGTVSQWSLILSQNQGGAPEIWSEHLRAILDEEERASLELILDLDQISAPAKKTKLLDDQSSLW